MFSLQRRKAEDKSTLDPTICELSRIFRYFDTEKRGSLTPAEFEEIWRHLLADHLRALQFLTLTKGGRRALLEQAEREHSDEAIRFLLAVELFLLQLRGGAHEPLARQCADAVAEALEIVREFVVPGAEREVNIDAAQRKEVLASAAFLREHVKLAAGDEFTRARSSRNERTSVIIDGATKALAPASAAAAAPPRAPGLAQLLERATHLFDRARDEVFKYLELDMFARFLESAHSRCNLSAEIFSEIDADHNGFITADEFLAWARASPGAMELFGAALRDLPARESVRGSADSQRWSESAERDLA